MPGSIATCRSHMMAVGVVSVFVNLLMLPGPLFMLQVTIACWPAARRRRWSLLILITGLFAMYGLPEFAAAAFWRAPARASSRC